MLSTPYSFTLPSSSLEATIEFELTRARLLLFAAVARRSSRRESRIRPWQNSNPARKSALLINANLILSFKNSIFALVLLSEIASSKICPKTLSDSPLYFVFKQARIFPSSSGKALKTRRSLRGSINGTFLIAEKFFVPKSNRHIITVSPRRESRSAAVLISRSRLVGFFETSIVIDCVARFLFDFEPAPTF